MKTKLPVVIIPGSDPVIRKCSRTTKAKIKEARRQQAVCEAVNYSRRWHGTGQERWYQEQKQYTVRPETMHRCRGKRIHGNCSRWWWRPGYEELFVLQKRAKSQGSSCFYPDARRLRWCCNTVAVGCRTPKTYANTPSQVRWLRFRLIVYRSWIVLSHC